MDVRRPQVSKVPPFFLASEAHHPHAPSRNEYVCLESMVSDYFSIEREINAYDALSAASKASNAAGKKYVRHALDHFKIDHAGRTYDFLIHEPLGVSVHFLRMMKKGSLPFVYAHNLVVLMLQALNYLHTDANLIHGGEYATFMYCRDGLLLTFSAKTFKKGTFFSALMTLACSKTWKSPSSPSPARGKSPRRLLFSSRVTWTALLASG